MEYISRFLPESGGFEPSLFVANCLSLTGLVLISYKTAKVLKSRVDIVVEVVEEEYRLQQHDAPVIAPAPQPAAQDGAAPSGGADVDLSPVDLKLQSVELKAEQLLQFWVMFSLLQFLAEYRVLYALELRAFLVITASIPSVFGATWIEYLFARLTPFIFGVRVPAAIRWTRRRLRRLGSTLSPAIRWLSAYVGKDAVLRQSNTPQLLALEASLDESLELLHVERRRRRKIELQLTYPTKKNSHLMSPSLAARLDPEDDESELLGEFADFRDGSAARVRVAQSTASGVGGGGGGEVRSPPHTARASESHSGGPVPSGERVTRGVSTRLRKFSSMDGTVQNIDTLLGSVAPGPT